MGSAEETWEAFEHRVQSLVVATTAVTATTMATLDTVVSVDGRTSRCHDLLRGQAGSTEATRETTSGPHSTMEVVSAG